MDDKETKRKYYLKHREEILERSRLWRLNNPEKCKKQNRTYYPCRDEREIYDKKYRKNNRKKIRLLNKKYANTNKEKVRIRNHKWYLKTRGTRRDVILKWRNSNRGSYLLNISQTKRRVRIKFSGSFTYKEWEKVKEKLSFTCLLCNRKEPEIKLTKDHIIPLSKGGSNRIENIQPLCQSCNSKKYNKIDEQFSVFF